MSQAKEATKWLVGGCYNFGNTLTNMFSNSKMTGFVDVALGCFFGSGAVGTISAVAFKAIAAVTLITTAPFSALVSAGAALIYTALGILTAATTLGFADAALEKAGLPTVSNMWSRAKNTVTKTGTMKSAPKAKTPNPFLTGAKIAVEFEKKADAQKTAAPAAKPAPKSGSDFDLK